MKVLTLDPAVLGDRERLHPLLARELSFPDWYGHNLDALHDCLTDLSEDVTIHLPAAEGLSPYARQVIAVLRRAAGSNPHLHLQ